MSVPRIFDPELRRVRRDRSVRAPAFFTRLLAEDLLERLEAPDAEGAALLLGAEPIVAAGLAERGMTVEVIDIAPGRAAMLGGRAGDPADLGLPAARYDLVVSTGLLDLIDDLPGMLVQLRLALRPGGLLLANFTGAPALPVLRAAVATADDERGRAVARFHPQIDVRNAGDLLQRTGFASPVADAEARTIAYQSLDGLLADLRDAGMGNTLRERYPAGPRWLDRVRTHFMARSSGDGRVHETFGWITIAGRAPEAR